MEEQKFDLDGEDALSHINEVFTSAARQLQRTYRDNGKNIVIVKNTVSLNTAIKLAAKTVQYHGIPPENISNCKKFAHVCFWIVKLHPASFVRASDVVALAKAVAADYFPLTEDIIDLRGDDIEADQKLNHILALYSFATLACDNFYEKQEAEAKVSRFMGDNVATEVLRSIQFHNYSARTMAMYLESLITDKIL